MKWLRLHPAFRWAPLFYFALDYLVQPGQSAHYDMSGWTQVCANAWVPNPACAGGPYGGSGMRVVSAQHTTPICGTPGQVFTAAMDGTYSIPANVRTIYFGPISNVNGCASRFTIEEQYYWPTALPHIVPPWVPQADPNAVPAPDPFGQPAPVKTPHPLQPYRPDSPYNRETGPKPDKTPAPARNPTPRRPGRDVKEQKTRSPWVKALFMVWSAATEVPDWVDAFWQAMPLHFRNRHKHAKLDQRVSLMIANIVHMNARQALQNVLYNVVEDAVAGRIIKALDSAGIGTTFGGGLYIKEGFGGMSMPRP